MKFALSFVAALALLTIVNGANKPEEIKLKYFEGNLDQIQEALLDINSAGNDLGKMEGKLEQLVAKISDLFAAEKALATSVDASVYDNAT